MPVISTIAVKKQQKAIWLQGESAKMPKPWIKRRERKGTCVATFIFEVA